MGSRGTRDGPPPPPPPGTNTDEDAEGANAEEAAEGVKVGANTDEAVTGAKDDEAADGTNDAALGVNAAELTVSFSASRASRFAAAAACAFAAAVFAVESPGAIFVALMRRSGAGAGAWNAKPRFDLGASGTAAPPPRKLSYLRRRRRGTGPGRLETGREGARGVPRVQMAALPLPTVSTRCSRPAPRVSATAWLA